MCCQAVCRQLDSCHGLLSKAGEELLGGAGDEVVTSMALNRFEVSYAQLPGLRALVMNYLPAPLPLEVVLTGGGRPC